MSFYSKQHMVVNQRVLMTKQYAKQQQNYNKEVCGRPDFSGTKKFRCFASEQNRFSHPQRLFQNRKGKSGSEQ